MQFNKLFLSIVFANFLLLGCLHAQSTPQLAPGEPAPQLASADSSKHALSPEEAGFGSRELLEYAGAEEAGRGSAATTRLFAENGFQKGFRADFTKLEGRGLKKLSQEVYQFSSAEGAKKFFEALELNLALQSSVSRMDAPKLGESSFGLTGSRLLSTGGAGVKVVDYVIVFLKANLVEAIDYLGLEESVSREEAIELARRASTKLAG